MKIVKINGQLGRQMFQYAFFIALNEANNGNNIQMAGKQLLPCQTFKLTYGDKFQPEPTFKLPWQNPYKGYATVREPENLAYTPSLVSEAADNVIFEGGWTSYRYFSNVEDEILRQFTFISPIINELSHIAPVTKNDETVAMHVVKPQSGKNVGTRDYYNWAVANINTFVPQPRYFIFTDNVKWSQKNIMGLPDSCTFVGTKNMTEATLMQAMSMASHVVASATLNDWWAAYLNANPDKIVVVPQKWNVEGTMPADLIPIHWTAIPLT